MKLENFKDTNYNKKQKIKEATQEEQLKLHEKWVQLRNEEEHYKKAKRFKAFIKELKKCKTYSGNSMLE